MNRMSIGESLEDFAARIGKSPPAAYEEWHRHGNEVAKAFQRPSPYGEMYTVASGKCFGMYPSVVANGTGYVRLS